MILVAILGIGGGLLLPLSGIWDHNICSSEWDSEDAFLDSTHLGMRRGEPKPMAT